MKHKKFPIHIWFLDADLQKSASFLTKKTLMKSIDGCIGSIISTYFYFIGIRSKKFYDYYFSKERENETLERFFPNWPLDKKPSFSAYGYKESKWCRQCHENYDYIVSYLTNLFIEYEYRNYHPHVNAKILDWLAFDIPQFDFPYIGINNIVLPWKTLDVKYRFPNIIDGYRKKFIDSFEENDLFKEYTGVPRDIPEFVMSIFNYTAL